MLALSPNPAYLFPVRLPLYAAILLTVISAALGVLIFPPFGCVALAPFAWLPLFFALHGRSAKAGFRLGALYGVLLFGGTLNWLMEIFSTACIALILMLALFPAIFGAVAATLSQAKRLPAWLVPVLIAVAWTGCEFYRSEWFVLDFPWITPGTGVPPNFLTPFIGVYGVSLLVALSGALLASSRTKAGRIAGAVLVALMLALTFIRPAKVTPQEPLRIATVQTEEQTIDSCLRLSATIQGPVDAIVWPEYCLSEDLRDRKPDLANARAIMKEKGARLLVLANPVVLPDHVVENTALSIGLTEVFGSHVKNRPVHFMERARPGHEASAIPTPLGKVGTTICFDNDYEAVVRRAVSNGAEFLLVPSEDGAAWTAREHLQHALFVPHRAAENGRWMAVASSSGLSQIVDPHGNVVAAPIPLMEEGVMTGEIGRETRLTIYTRCGWVIGPVCTVATAAMILALLFLEVRRLLAKRKTA